MRSRSSRLFIVLLHLVGVSTNLPAKLWDWNVGIVGAHPTAILLERLELESAGGLDGLLRRLGGAGYDVEGLLEEPYWLQDDADGKCMGPGGFSECGDATLWLVRRRPARGGHGRRKGKRGVFSVLGNRKGSGAEGSDEDDGTRWVYGLQLIDANLLSSSAADADDASDKNEAWGRMRPWGDKSSRKAATAECLIAPGGRKRARQHDGQKEDRESLRLVPCGSDDAWGWRVDGDGVLVQDSQGSAEKAKDGRRGKTLMGVYGRVDPAMGKSGHVDTRRCLHRTETSTEVAPCFEEDKRSPTSNANASNATGEGSQGPQSRVVRFSLIRYQAGGSGVAAKLPKFSPSDDGFPHSEGEDLDSPTGEAKPLNRSPERTQDASPQAQKEEEESHLPHTSRTSRNHASGPLMHPDLKPSSQLLFANVGTNPPKRPAEKKQQLPSGTSAQDRMRPGGHHQSQASARSLSAGRGSALPKMGGPTSEAKKHLLHKTPPPKKVGGLPSSLPSMPDDDAPHKPRKIPTHPYIANVKSPGVWEDPQTGLEYLTDLSGYLGHDRKEVGRHTLMGVGLYTRTVFNIKVYGCAFYAAKRDVLADPGYAPFAAMTAEALQGRDDFYEHLMDFPSEESGAVDRTLFLKMNMQLATETMRTSLDADWSLMTSEQKNLLISSSFKERPADERMLAKIKSKENSSRCSCGQSAPPEYEADPECCARGTELVFTWRKNGNLELRIDGRVMDRFEEPGLGRAIFYEYLRGDDPMSMDARNHFADGFPFLLAPLAQVRGVSSPVRQQGEVPSTPEESSVGVLRFFGNMAGAVGSQAASATSWVQGGAAEAMGNVGKTAKAVGDTARNIGAEMEKRRVAAVEHVLSLPEQGSQFLASLSPFKKAQRGEKVFQLRVLKSDGSTTGWDNVSNESLQNILGGPVAQTLGQNLGRGSEDATSPMSDEIGVIKHPTMNFTHQLFLYTVHLYLMLLLIVSVPRSYTTKLVVKRAGSSRGSSDDESVDSILCASPDEKTSSRSNRLRGMEVAVQLQITSIGETNQGKQRHSHDQPHSTEMGGALAADRACGDKKAGRRRDSSQRTSSPEHVTEMKKAFSYFL